MRTEIFFSLCLMMLSCTKSNISDLNTISPAVVDPLFNVTDTIRKITYAEAGVYFLKRENKDSNYIRRAAEMIPSIELDGDGVLYCAWYANKSKDDHSGEGSGAYVTLSISGDKGETWLYNELVIAPIDTLDRIFDECLWRDPNGIVHLFWSRSKKSWWDGVAGVWECTVQFAGSKLLITSIPQLFISSGIMINKPIQLKNTNDFLFSQALYDIPPKTIFSGNLGPNIYGRSYDTNAKTLTNSWSFASIVVLPKSIVLEFIEPQLLQLTDDTVACFIRTYAPGGIAFATATLSGGLMNWSQFKKYTPIGPNPSMRSHVARLASGNILFVTCNSIERRNMTAYLSLDNSLSISFNLLLDERPGVSYPDATQGPDGTIYIVYDRERTGNSEIMLVKISEADIKSQIKPKVNRKRIDPF
jgi:hypothetical protein